jgi:hypothetical protein
MAAARNAFTLFNWRDIVEKFDDENRHQNNLYPVVYVFSNEATRRDSGPRSGVYEG